VKWDSWGIQSQVHQGMPESLNEAHFSWLQYFLSSSWDWKWVYQIDNSKTKYYAKESLRKADSVV